MPRSLFEPHHEPLIDERYYQREELVNLSLFLQYSFQDIRNFVGLSEYLCCRFSEMLFTPTSDIIMVSANIPDVQTSTVRTTRTQAGDHYAVS